MLTVFLVAAAAPADSVKEGIDKHITQVCLAYNGVEYVEARRTWGMKLERGSQKNQILVLFSVESPDGANFDYQFVSVLNQFDVPNGVRPVFFQKIGGKGVRYINAITNDANGAILTGYAYGPNDPMSTPSFFCSFRLNCQNGVFALKEDQAKERRSHKGSQPTALTP